MKKLDLWKVLSFIVEVTSIGWTSTSPRLYSQGDKYWVDINSELDLIAAHKKENRKQQGS